MEPQRKTFYGPEHDLRQKKSKAVQFGAWFWPPIQAKTLGKESFKDRS